MCKERLQVALYGFRPGQILPPIKFQLSKILGFETCLCLVDYGVRDLVSGTFLMSKSLEGFFASICKWRDFLYFDTLLNSTLSQHAKEEISPPKILSSHNCFAFSYMAPFLLHSCQEQVFYRFLPNDDSTLLENFPNDSPPL